MYPILNTLPSLPHAQLPRFLTTLTPLCSSYPSVFAPHLPALLAFLPTLILPSVDPGPTPTVSQPFPGHEARFSFPPTTSSEPKGKVIEERDEETEEVRKTALEFMVSLSEAKPAMVKRVEGWIPAIVKGCLEGMGELQEDSTQVWLESDVNPSVLHNLAQKLTVFFSPEMIPQTTIILISMSRRLIVSLVLVVDKQCCLQRSNKYLPC